jgi:hypothetical protein
MENKFSKFIKEMCLPVRDLSEILGVSPQMIYYWREYGIRNWKTAGRVAKQLKCQPEDLIGGL